MFTFSRHERLKSRTLIGRLFRGGNSFIAYPLRVVWVPLNEEDRIKSGISDHRAQVAVSVSKRHFKTAVSRNRMKRRIREAYRLHKQELYAKLAEKDQSIAFMLILLAKEEVPYAEIEAGIRKMVRKINDE